MSRAPPRSPSTEREHAAFTSTGEMSKVNSHYVLRRGSKSDQTPFPNFSSEGSRGQRAPADGHRKGPRSSGSVQPLLNPLHAWLFHSRDVSPGAPGRASPLTHHPRPPDEHSTLAKLLLISTQLCSPSPTFPRRPLLLNPRTVSIPAAGNSS